MSQLKEKMNLNNKGENIDMDRFHLAARIDEGVKEHQSERNRSNEVVHLQREYEIMKKNLDILNVTLKEYYSKMDGMSDLRMKVSFNFL